MGSGQDVQLSEDPRFDRLGRYAFPASPDGSDLRIRRYEQSVEGQDALSDRRPEAGAYHYL